MTLLWSDLFRANLYKGENAALHLWQMLDVLFDPWPHLLAFAAILMTAAFTLGTGGGVYAEQAILVALGHFLLRWLGGLWYYKRAGRRNLEVWMRFFIASALASGAAWGTSITLLLYGAPSSSRYLILTVACVIIQSATARAFMAPLPLICQTGLMIIQVVAVSVYHGDWIIAPAALLFAAFQLGHMRGLIRLRLQQLQAEAEKDALLTQVARTNEELRIANDLLEKKALTDVLTGLPNRRAFDRRLQDDDPRLHPTLLPYSLVLFDVDHFKPFNDTHGHPAGDACLAAIGTELRAMTFPPGHLVARYGGEEFAVILPRTDGPAALAQAQTIREKLAALAIPVSGGSVGITVSLGVASLAANATEDPSRLLTRADIALYRAKQLGRNRVEHEDPTMTTA